MGRAGGGPEPLLRPANEPVAGFGGRYGKARGANLEGGDSSESAMLFEILVGFAVVVWMGGLRDDDVDAVCFSVV